MRTTITYADGLEATYLWEVVKDWEGGDEPWLQRNFDHEEIYGVEVEDPTACAIRMMAAGVKFPTLIGVDELKKYLTEVASERAFEPEFMKLMKWGS